MDAGPARGVFGIAPQPIKVRLRPGVNASIRIDAVIQVNARIVLVEHIPDAVIGASAQRLNSLVIARPGRRMIGCCSFPRASVVGDFGERALALFFAPAHPLWTALQFLQGWYLLCVRHVCLWLHSFAAFPYEVVSWEPDGAHVLAPVRI